MRSHDPQKEEAEAAKLYAEFVESFGEEPLEEKPGPRPFVRSHTILPGVSASQAGEAMAMPRIHPQYALRNPQSRFKLWCPSGQGPKASGKYVPSFMPPSLAAAVNRDGGSTASSSGFSSARNGVSRVSVYKSNADAFPAWDDVKTCDSHGHDG